MNQRIREFINILKEQRIVLSDGEFASEVGMGKSQLSEVLSGKRKVSEKYIRKMRTRFPELNEEWIRYGKGNMLCNSSSAENHSVALTADEIKNNEISVNNDKTIALLVAELSAQRRLAEKIIDQNGEILLQNRELLAMIKNK